MKTLLILPLILLTASLNAADAVKQLNADLAKQQTSFYQKFELRPYASAFADGGDLNFKNGAVGLETIFNLNKNIGFSADLLGKDDASGPLIDRAGVNLITSLPVAKHVSLYAEGGFGYWTDGNLFDMVVRGGAKAHLTKNISFFGDIGQGFRFEDAGSYQQVRAGFGINF